VTAALDRASSAGAPSPVIRLLLTGTQPAAAGARRKAERWKKGCGGETFEGFAPTGPAPNLTNSTPANEYVTTGREWAVCRGKNTRLHWLQMCLNPEGCICVRSETDSQPLTAGFFGAGHWVIAGGRCCFLHSGNRLPRARVPRVHRLSTTIALCCFSSKSTDDGARRGAGRRS
jgi:hypothetical protein